MEKSLNNAVLRLNNDKVELHWQVYFTPTMDAESAILAYDLHNKKYVCDVPKAEMRDVKRYVMFEPELDQYRDHYIKNIQLLIESLNSDIDAFGAAKIESKIVAEAVIVFDKILYEELAKIYNLPSFDLQEVENEN
jgi:hypothetical protein